MACKDCGGGIWQCSKEDDPCGMHELRAQKDEPLRDVRWFTVYTKEAGNSPMQQIFEGKGTPNPNSGWELAGEIGLEFEVHKDEHTGKPFVRVGVIDS